ncbi:zinc finger protein 185 isoform X2 [Phascolarctos cinereus]|uniref:Zinc finger protein 185 isoform X2 n=1 Tax=Phascolarctos cinereus TaxID=38626 RepID=A0A6P5J8U3_PHACI|nr:zinc finger protein 185 isoform X2 [Phascolarctos cinereus]
MPFGRLPKGYSEPGEGDQKNVIKQMKVRTIIKDDSSWIHKPDDTEGQTIELPPSKEPSSTAPPVVTPQKDRPPAPKPSSGYIIRGIFTKPTDSTSVPQTRYSATSEPPKRPTVPAKPVTANLPRTSPSAYKVASEEYKKKMAEASCNVFQRSATWERSSVLSDAKKSAMPAAQVASFCPPSKSSTQDVAPPVMAETVEVEEDEVPPERSQTLPSLARQIFGFTSSDSSREKAGSSAWTGNVSRSFFSSARVQEYRKKEETHTAVGHDPKLESSLLELSLDSSGKRSSTCSTDSNRSSSGSQNDLDEIQITSKKKSTLSYGDRYVSSTESYEGPDNQQFFEANKPRYGSEEYDVFSPDDQYDPSVNLQYYIPSKNTTKYASASIVTSTEKRYGSSASSDEPTSSKLQRFASATREKAIMGSMAASAPDSASASDNEQPSNFSKISGASCTHCLKEIRTGPKITLEHLGTCFHECCFKCEICEKIMANMLDHVYIHKGIIHCDQCYARLF